MSALSAEQYREANARLDVLESTFSNEQVDQAYTDVGLELDAHMGRRGEGSQPSPEAILDAVEGLLAHAYAAIDMVRRLVAEREDVDVNA